ncbi:MAG: TonB-dependent receptor [Vicinamibacteria bacterium]
MAHLTRFALRFAVLAAVAAVLFAPLPASAQSLYGSVVGNISDAQGAAVPGVTVTATNTGTGLKLDSITNAEGSYTFRNMPPGVYDVSAALTGFRTLNQTGVRVSAGNPIRLDMKLEVGALTETLNVVSESTLLQTEKADLHTEISSKEIVNLPLNQFRNYQKLIDLVPGATPAQFQNAEIDTPGRSLRTWVNGTQPNSNATRIDGAVSVNVWLPHHVGYVTSSEAIETVNVATNNFDADQGMAGGAAVTLVTKSGTNELHGSAFWFGNTESLNANTFFNNAFGLPKPDLKKNIYGATLGGPIVKNKMFFFGSWERYSRDNKFNQTFGVPTAKMRAGDFSEVAAAYPTFRLYNPFTGAANGTGRDQFANFAIPSSLISPQAAKVLNYFPLPNSAQDLNSNKIADDYVISRTQYQHRDNYDVKLTYQRSQSHSIWAKFGMLRNEGTGDNFILGFDNPSLGTTHTYVGGVGHTWTLSPTLVLDGNFGLYQMNQTVTGPDYGTNFSTELGIPGVNGSTERYTGLPTFSSTYSIGGTPSWMPLFRTEKNWTFSSAITKVFPKHEVRVGFDFVRLELNHYQAEFGDYGLKGGFSFSNNTTGAVGYTSPGWNSFGAFLLGLPNYYSKDFQELQMTGRENQFAFYVRDRWSVTQKLTLSLGVRAEYYPLMTRADSGIERLDLSTWTLLMGGRGNVPKDVGIDMQKLYFAPRLGAMYRLSENSVIRAGYGRTVNPLPWSRPMRGAYPYDVFLNKTGETYGWSTTLAQGIPSFTLPDLSSGRVQLPVGVFTRTPEQNNVDRGIIQQWNVAFEQRLPGNISAEIAYVGTKTDGGYADLNINYGVPGGGNAARQYFAIAGTTTVNSWGSRLKSRYKGLQLALNRPFRNGLMLKGAYTLSEAKDMADEDGWVGLTWNTPIKYADNLALAGFDRTHIAQLGFLYELPFFKGSDKGAAKAILGGWQFSGIAAWYSGTPYSISGTNNALNCQGCGSVLINFSGDTPSPVGAVGSSTETYYDPSLFSQPTGLDYNGFGTSKRNQFRRPNVWNVDLSLFKSFQIGRVRPEIRIDAANVFNHVNWGAPVTTFTDPNFLKFTPGSADSPSNGTATGSTNTPGPRMVQIGLRLEF